MPPIYRNIFHYQVSLFKVRPFAELCAYILLQLVYFMISEKCKFQKHISYLYKGKSEYRTHKQS